MYTDTVTLFNRFEGSQEVIWYPSVLYLVNLSLDKSAILSKFGAQSQDRALLNIRYTGKYTVNGKQWLPPQEWRNQAEDKLPGTLTFADGQSFDFFWLGKWPDEQLVPDADYRNGFYDYMNRERDYVFAVTGVSGPYALIPHFEITGK